MNRLRTSARKQAASTSTDFLSESCIVRQHVIELLDCHWIYLVTSFANALFRLNQVYERSVDHDTHRRVVVGTVRNDLARPFELSLTFIGDLTTDLTS